MDDWLVSIVKGGKVVELYFSDELKDLRTIQALHKNCGVETMHIGGGVKEEKKAEPQTTKPVRWQARKVCCVETGEIYDSAFACSTIIKVPRSNVYKAIQRGITAGGFHFKYVKE